MNRKLPVLLLLLFFWSLLPMSSPPWSLLQASTLSSSSILVDVDDETGRVFLKTVGLIGEKQEDESKNLLFYDRPPSSYCVVFTDGDAFIFGGGAGRYAKRPSTVNGIIEAVWENDAVEVSQKIELVRRKGAADADAILVTYKVKNKRTVSTETGLQILFDTYLGENDPYHFELSGGRRVMYETVYEGSELPQYWLSAEKDEGSAGLRGVLTGSLVTTPDKIIFANYRALSQKLFDYKVRRKKRFDLLPYSKNDSAVALLFRPAVLHAGKTREYRAIVGLPGPGEYARGEASKKEAASAGPTAFKAEEEIPPPVLGEDMDLEKLRNALLSIEGSRKSLEMINNYLKQIDRALGDGSAAFEEKAFSDEEILGLKKELEELLTR